MCISSSRRSYYQLIIIMGVDNSKQFSSGSTPVSSYHVLHLLYVVFIRFMYSKFHVSPCPHKYTVQCMQMLKQLHSPAEYMLQMPNIRAITKT